MKNIKQEKRQKTGEKSRKKRKRVPKGEHPRWHWGPRGRGSAHPKVANTRRPHPPGNNSQGSVTHHRTRHAAPADPWCHPQQTMKRNAKMKNMKASPSSGLVLTPPVHRGPKIKFSQKGNRHFLELELLDDLFSFCLLFGRLKKEKKREEKIG